MSNVKTWSLLNLAGFVGMLTLNVLANALPLFGRNTGEISALYPNLFVPAGFTFGIWGLIYLLLAVFVVAQLRGAFGGGASPGYVAAIGPWFVVSCVANGSWILVWHALQPGLALLVMGVLLTALIQIYRVLPPAPAEGKYTARLPFSVYLGWISVALIANATALLVHLGWGGWGLDPVVWTVAMIGVAALAGLVFLWKYADVPYALVIIWALYGILARTDGPPISTALWMGLLVLGAGVLWRAVSWVRQ